MDLTAGDLANALEAMDRARAILLHALIAQGMSAEEICDHLSTASAPLSRALYRMKVEVKP